MIRVWKFQIDQIRNQAQDLGEVGLNLLGTDKTKHLLQASNHAFDSIMFHSNDIHSHSFHVKTREVMPRS